MALGKIVPDRDIKAQLDSHIDLSFGGSESLSLPRISQLSGSLLRARYQGQVTDIQIPWASEISDEMAQTDMHLRHDFGE